MKMRYKVSDVCQLLDKTKFPDSKTIIKDVDVTKTVDGGLHVYGTAVSGGGRNSWGMSVDIVKDHIYLNLLKGNNKLTAPFLTLASDTSKYFRITDIAVSPLGGLCNWGFNINAEDYDETIYPQLFDLTEMYGAGNEPTTVEQFRQDFPEEMYPYSPYCMAPINKIAYVSETGKTIKMKP